MTKYIIANWKMQISRSEGIAFVHGLENHLASIPSDTIVVLCPPFPLLDLCSHSSAFSLGAQSCSSHQNGAFTGEVSSALLKEIGCQYVIIGHSERRRFFQESGDIVVEKIHRVLEQGLSPLVCVGEPLDIYESQQTQSYLEKLLEKEIKKSLSSLLVAYEPLWAIGSGKTPSLDEIEKVHHFLKARLNCPVLYGGSVTPGNAASILSLPSVDGVLVGGASLSLETFIPILRSIQK